MSGKHRSTATIGLSAIAAILAAGAGFAASNFPPGEYVAGGTTLRFGTDGKVHVMEHGKEVVLGTYTSTANQLVITDVSGPYACAEGKKTGTYAWQMHGSDVTLTKVEDACDDRASDLVGHPWRKK